jgi:hypothetical protein
MRYRLRLGKAYGPRVKRFSLARLLLVTLPVHADLPGQVQRFPGRATRSAQGERAGSVFRVRALEKLLVSIRAVLANKITEDHARARSAGVRPTITHERTRDDPWKHAECGRAQATRPAGAIAARSYHWSASRRAPAKVHPRSQIQARRAPKSRPAACVWSITPGCDTTFVRASMARPRRPGLSVLLSDGQGYPPSPGAARPR